ncbi:glycosyltransferase family 4 protein [Thermotoga sp. KOL6]|uniref:glycosyltransferase family 4 protein n=1 Tax=Thermotoga sp. KOL6 TaxID=126741 RepID=UPI000C795637|nr:glycosyltransferase family 4 protein [Thermotoga sp. KOL6]PLV59458.1 glycosyltransferase WbuB [Thermotoga sp. KOL6]
MNIAILNHYASIPEMGSAETRHFELAKRFVSEGYNVDIYVGDFSHLLKKRWSEVYGWRFSKEGINFLVVKTRTYRKNSFDRFLSSYDYYRNGKHLILKGDYDVIIASSPHPFSWSLGWYYVKKKGKGKFFIEIRDVWPDDLLKFGSLSSFHPVAKLFDLMCRKYYPKADGLILLLPDLSKHFKRLKIQPRKHIFIPNGIDVKQFENPKRCVTVDDIFSKIPQGRVKVVYAGSIAPHKGIKEFLQTLKKVPKDLRNKFSFLFIGPSQPNYLEELKVISKDLSNVFFFDPVPKICVPYLLQKADFLLFTLSSAEMNDPAVSSYKVLDYMASGKPVLCVDIEGLPFKKTGGAIFFNKKNLTETLRTLLERDFSHLGLKNREFVEQERSWDPLYKKLKDFLFS